MAVDTPILVKNSKNDCWHERHFAKYVNGRVYAWNDGKTSWTEDGVIAWEYAKLAEEGKQYD